METYNERLPTIAARVSKGMKILLLDVCDRRGIPIQSFIKDALREKIIREGLGEEKWDTK